MIVTEELREYMAKLGFRTIDEMVGRVDKLKKKENLNNWKAERVDLSLVLDKSQVDYENGDYACTHYRRVAFQNNYSLVSLKLDTGRTHQIRVHMKYINHPLII